MRPAEPPAVASHLGYRDHRGGASSVGSPAASRRRPALLDHMGQLVRQQSHARCCARGVPAGSEENVRAVRERLGLKAATQLHRLIPGLTLTPPKSVPNPPSAPSPPNPGTTRPGPPPPA